MGGHSYHAPGRCIVAVLMSTEGFIVEPPGVAPRTRLEIDGLSIFTWWKLNSDKRRLSRRWLTCRHQRPMSPFCSPDCRLWVVSKSSSGSAGIALQRIRRGALDVNYGCCHDGVAEDFALGKVPVEVIDRLQYQTPRGSQLDWPLLLGVICNPLP